MDTRSRKRMRIHSSRDGDRSCFQLEPCRLTMYGIFFRRSEEIFSTYTPVPPENDQVVDLTSFGMLPGYPNLKLLDSCSGLLLFDLCDETKPVIVCNPASNTWMAIKRFTSTRSCIGLKVALDPHFNSAFRIVTVFEADRGLELVVFNSITRSHHRNHVNVELAPDTGRDDRFTLAGDYLYMHAASGELMRLGFMKYGTIEKVPLPKVGFGRYHELFGESGGSAHYAVCHESKMVVWVLHSVERDWELKHAASTEDLIEQHRSEHGQLGCRAGSVMPLAFHPDLDVVFLQVDWKIYSFDPASDGFNEIGGEKGPNPEGEKYLVYPYTKCFIDVSKELIPTPGFTKIMG